MAWRHMGGEEENSYSYLNSALDGGEWSASRPGRALPPGKGPPVPIVQGAGRAPEPVWTQRLEEKFSAPVGDRTQIVQPIVRQLLRLHQTTGKIIFFYFFVFTFLEIRRKDKRF
jgi:hypothetical protein